MKLARGGLGDEDDGGLLDESAATVPVLAGIAAASVQGRVAPASRVGVRVRRSPRGRAPPNPRAPPRAPQRI
jgi:hypothetical protein